MLEVKKIAVRKNAKIELDNELKKFSNSPSKYKKFLRTITKFYRLEKPTNKNKSEYCERIISSFFTYSQIKKLNANEKKKINELIKELVVKAGGFLRFAEERLKKENNKDFTDSEFNEAFRNFNHETYELFEDGIDIEESNGEIGYFYTENK